MREAVESPISPFQLMCVFLRIPDDELAFRADACSSLHWQGWQPSKTNACHLTKAEVCFILR